MNEKIISHHLAVTVIIISLNYDNINDWKNQ